MILINGYSDQLDWINVKLHGWAPGNYYCTCVECNKEYIGDKRSSQCYPCAKILENKPVKSGIVVNFYGGPGTGKSTMAARVFSELKTNNVNCELVTEYAKKKVWEDSLRTLQNQIYVFGKQQFSMWTCAKHVDVIVTDSPLLLSNIYGGDELLNKLVIQEFNKYYNINIFLNRVKEYNPKGRTQTEDEAKQIDDKIMKMLIDDKQTYSVFDGHVNSVDDIVWQITSETKNAKNTCRFIK